ncbi:hypothetical protein VV99743_03322 [Vibrio vulnificus]|uniref:hypothetical protein n=1 Tax=Vibrio vulnificus TaxID=672 RepID=UPI00092CDCA4|nr:hypothetical protein [Vibrio vulnificus]OJI30782.1 hypothetical protein VV99743_03322 [Vibrio vulnificus]
MFFSKKAKEKDLMSRVNTVTNYGEYMVLDSALRALLNEKSNKILQAAISHLNADYPIQSYVFDNKIVFTNHASDSSLEFKLPYSCNYSNYRYIEEIEKDIIFQIQSTLLDFSSARALSITCKEISDGCRFSSDGNCTLNDKFSVVDFVN